MSEELAVERPSGKIGMWLFIASEILLFGGLFLLYAMYRFDNPDDFHTASLELSVFAGTLNTAILITSSFTVALSVFFLNAGKIALSKLLILATIAFALGFLVVKGFEWAEKFAHGLYPNSEVLLGKPKGEILYFGLYYMMTGLHAFHVIVGMSVFTWVFVRISQARVTPAKPVILENAGLYWHLVDIIWIFLFPLFYLLS